MTTAADVLLQVARDRGLPTAPAGDEAALARTVAANLGLPFVELAGRTIAADARDAVSREFAQANTVLPFARHVGVLHVAVADPGAVDVLDEISLRTGLSVRPALAAVEDIRQAIARWPATGLREEAPEPDLASGGGNDAADAPIIRLVHDLIADAAKRRASDIHLEPLGSRFRVRYRIDGVLHEVDGPPRRLQLPVISRLKLMANISIAEKRVPQDGRIQVPLAGRALDLRVSSLPSVHGESVVMRILDPGQGLRGLSELGLLDDDRALFERQVAAADGMTLVTGPTGSGKTSTLYASVRQLNQADRKIITVEDPVEYQIPGVNQVPVNPATGLTFAAALRAMLRQAPNVVMVGEVRDRETAGIAIHAALTGHAVLSSLHTNDAPSAVTRLLDLGVKPFLVAAALRTVVAQRLVRRVCVRCRASCRPAPRELHALGLTAAQAAGGNFARGAGCAACQGTGYQGRLGLFEIFLVHDGVRAMIYDHVTAPRLRQQARRDGMRTMREDGIRKVLAGLTTIEEVVSATTDDQF